VPQPSSKPDTESHREKCAMPQDELHDAPEAANEPPPVIRAESLFGERKEIWIEYHGERYRLRITRRGKLILQK